MYSKRILFLLGGYLFGQQAPVATFGTTVFSSSGLHGKLYLIDRSYSELPRFKELQSVGSIYTTSLQITPRGFGQGFPGITDRAEWFAIDYTGRFYVDQPGIYKFRLLSDDGAKLYINDKLLIDNDGLHPPEALDGRAQFSRGVYTIRVSYFQGPPEFVALVLSVARPGDETWKIFDTNDFLPPADGKQLLPGKLSKIKRGFSF